jgi:phospholipid transport system substrate-binding protein
MRTLLVSLGLLLVFALPSQGADAPAAAAVATPGLGPQELMDKVSRDLLRELDADRAAITKDPARLRALVDKHLLPHFDTDYAARLVLGKHWRTATDAQRKRFVEAFYGALMADYGSALSEFTADRLRILPFRGDPAADSATVRTEVKRDDGTPVPVNYTLRRTPQGWKAWDVTIEGISYVRSFRNDFGAEIDQKGLDAVITRLEARNAAAPQARPAAARPAAGTG